MASHGDSSVGGGGVDAVDVAGAAPSTAADGLGGASGAQDGDNNAPVVAQAGVGGLATLDDGGVGGGFIVEGTMDVGDGGGDDADDAKSKKSKKHKKSKKSKKAKKDKKSKKSKKDRDHDAIVAGLQQRDAVQTPPPAGDETATTDAAATDGEGSRAKTPKHKRKRHHKHKNRHRHDGATSQPESAGAGATTGSDDEGAATSAPQPAGAGGSPLMSPLPQPTTTPQPLTVTQPAASSSPLPSPLPPAGDASAAVTGSASGTPRTGATGPARGLSLTSLRISSHDLAAIQQSNSAARRRAEARTRSTSGASAQSAHDPTDVREDGGEEFPGGEDQLRNRLRETETQLDEVRLKLEERNHESAILADAYQGLNNDYHRLKTKASSHGLVLQDGTLADSDSDDSDGDGDGNNAEAKAAAMLAELEVELQHCRDDAQDKANQLADLHHDLSVAMVESAASAEALRAAEALAAERAEELTTLREERDALLESAARKGAADGDGAEVASLRKRVQELTAKAQAQDDTIRELEEDNAQLLAENEALQNDTVSLSNAVKLSEAEAKQVGAAIAEMHLKDQQIVELAAENDALKAQVGRLEQEIKSLRDQLEEAKTAAPSDDTPAATGTATAAASDVAAAQADAKAARDHAAELELQVKDLQDLMARLTAERDAAERVAAAAASTPAVDGDAAAAAAVTAGEAGSDNKAVAAGSSSDTGADADATGSAPAAAATTRSARTLWKQVATLDAVARQLREELAGARQRQSKSHDTVAGLRRRVKALEAELVQARADVEAARERNVPPPPQEVPAPTDASGPAQIMLEQISDLTHKLYEASLQRTAIEDKATELQRMVEAKEQELRDAEDAHAAAQARHAEAHDADRRSLQEAHEADMKRVKDMHKATLSDVRKAEEAKRQEVLRQVADVQEELSAMTADRDAKLAELRKIKVAHKFMAAARKKADAKVKQGLAALASREKELLGQLEEQRQASDAALADRDVAQAEMEAEVGARLKSIEANSKSAAAKYERRIGQLKKKLAATEEDLTAAKERGDRLEQEHAEEVASFNAQVADLTARLEALTKSHQDAVHENMDYAACLAEEKERVESLTKSLADAQAEEQRVKQHLEDLGAGEGRTLLDALQAARKARNQVKDLAAQLEAKTNKLLEREAEAAMLHDTASSGQALATDSKQRIKDLESQVQALRWKMAMAGISSSVPDTKPGDTNTALANVLGMSPAVVTTPGPSQSPRPRATAPSSQPLMSTPSRATATRSVASGKSTGGGRGSLAQQAERESLHMMAHNILNNSTTEPGGRVAALRKAAARIAAGQSPLPDGAGLDTAIARRSGGAASYQSPTRLGNGSASGRRYRYS